MAGRDGDYVLVRSLRAPWRLVRAARWRCVDGCGQCGAVHGVVAKYWICEKRLQPCGHEWRHAVVYHRRRLLLLLAP